MLEERIEQDLKTALLAHEALRVSTLRVLKGALLNVKVAEGKRDSGLSDSEVQAVLAKEAKKRQETADIYLKAGEQDRADKELAEKAILQAYLPTQLTEAELVVLIDEIIAQMDAQGPSDMGRVIGAVKAKTGAAADGALVARLAKEKLSGGQA